MFSWHKQTYESRQAKIAFGAWSDSKGPDQTARMRSLIRGTGFDPH